ncbi:hypothetical protein [Microvirga brassicacearum]|uniref:Uncharacterized protein n=1 Tax=Microvirga brassicacearum TaxID=2580413 RepID=A0A5N3PH33_9HYPH|nr:hypothetical protein [Microvirga brassicacearum]KAB0269046.1 hypothetical protein FEZ63_02760 [Microvirga brassicacearum]
MPNRLKAAQVHRFREHVALYIRNDQGDAATVYLTRAEAVTIASNLNRCVRDIKARSFVDSLFSSTEIKPEA